MKTIIIAAAIAAGGLAMPAIAQTGDRTRTVTVSDLDLSRRTDVATLDRRLSAAVWNACTDPTASGSDKREIARQCRIDTTRTVAAQRDAIVAQARGTALAGR